MPSNTLERAMEKMIEIFKALSDPIRLRILHLLTKGELCVCDLIEILELPQSTISRHLAILKNTKIVSSRKEGLWHHYKINRQAEKCLVSMRSIAMVKWSV